MYQCVGGRACEKDEKGEKIKAQHWQHYDH